jgi:autotransporter-associated beta strand protein
MAGASFFVVTLSASAQIYWDGTLTGTNALWSDITGWTTDSSLDVPDPDAIPGANDIAAFSSSNVAANQTILLNAAQSAAGLQFPLSSVTHTLTSNNTTARTLTIGASGIELTNSETVGGNVTIGGTNTLNLSLGAEQSWFVGSNRTLTIANPINGSGNFSKTGGGTLQLNASNTFTGNFTLSEGLLSLNNAGALGSASTPFIIAGGSIQNASTTAALTLNAKPVTLAGNFTYVVPSNNGATNGFLTFGTSPVTLAPTSGNNITVSNGSGVIAFPGPVSGDGKGIIKTGAGTLALLGDNTYTGTTELQTSANLRIGGPGSIATTNVFMNGGLIELGGAVVENTTFELGTAPGQIRFRSGGTTTGTTAHGGFGAASGYRKVSVTSEGVPNAPLVWGVTPHFMGSGDWGGSNGIFLLSTPSSNGTIELTNDLNFGNKDRRFAIRNGSAPNMPDAVLSGKLTNGRFSLQGGGTVLLSNPENELTGTTLITAGTILRVPQISGYLGTSNVVIESGLLEVSKDTVVPLGTEPGQVSFTGNGGFSVYDGGGNISIGGNGEPLVWGTNGFAEAGTGVFILGGVSSDGTTRLTNPIDLGDSIRTISVQNGGGYVDAALDAVLSGTGGINLTGGGVLQLANPNNTYTGVTQVSSGALALDKLINGGLPSAMGASSNDAANLLFTGGSLRYNGPATSTDRLFEMRATLTLNSVGFGPLAFTNTAANAFTATSTAATTRSLTLTGYSRGLNVINSGITDSTAGTLNNPTSLIKSGCLTWSMGGNNTYTGSTNIAVGELILDYSEGRNPIGGTGSVIIDNSYLTLKGKPTGQTSAAFTTLRFGGGNNALGNVLKLDAPEGSGGIKLAVTNFGGNTSTGNSLLSNLVDLSSNAGNEITVTNVNNGFSLENNIIVANAPSAGRSNLIVRDSQGYGFATLSGPLPANLTRLTSASSTPLDASNTGNTTNFHLRYDDLPPDSGDVPNGRKLTRTAALVYSSLSIDATGGPVHLDLASSNYGNSTGNNGRGILITGDHDVKFTGTGTTAYSPFIYHYGTGKFEFNIPTPNGFSVIAGGTGLYEYSGPLGGTDARFYLANCLFRFTGNTNYANLNGGGIWVGNDSVIEIANDLNGAAAGDFSNSLGNGNGQVRLMGNSGISAFGGHRVVNFGGNQSLATWGSNYFMTNANGGDGDTMLRLSSPKSDSTIEITNPISLNGRERVVNVANGSAEIDAILSGTLSGVSSGIIKRGEGTLVLDGENTYNGLTVVEEGILRLTKAYLADTSTVRVNPADGGKLDLTHGQTDTVAELYVNGVKMPDGIYGSNNLSSAISGTGKLNVGGVPVSGTPYDEWVSTNDLPEDKDGPEDDADGDRLRNLLEYAVGSNPSVPSGGVLSKAPGNTGAVLFNRAAGRTDINTVVETSTDLSPGSWTIVATSTAGAAFVSNDAGVIVTDSGNPSGNSAVSVTDNRAPVPAKRFYRIRVEK